MEDSKRIEDCHPYLQTRWPMVLEMYRAIMRRDLFLTSTYRSPETQARLYAQGRTAPGQIVTSIDGTLRKSFHNYFPSRAFDVCVDADLSDAVKPSWKEELYEPLGYIAHKVGLAWGGEWTSFRDMPHLQIPRSVELEIITMPDGTHGDK